MSRAPISSDDSLFAEICDEYSICVISIEKDDYQSTCCIFCLSRHSHTIYCFGHITNRMDSYADGFRDHPNSIINEYTIQHYFHCLQKI